MKRKSVESSHIASIGHEGEILEVEYKADGVVWQYTPITDQLHRDLMGSQSKGSFMAQFIKNAKVGRKIPPSDQAMKAARKVGNLMLEPEGSSMIYKIAQIIDNEMSRE